MRGIIAYRLGRLWESGGMPHSPTLLYQARGSSARSRGKFTHNLCERLNRLAAVQDEVVRRGACRLRRKLARLSCSKAYVCREPRARRLQAQLVARICPLNVGPRTPSQTSISRMHLLLAALDPSPSGNAPQGTVGAIPRATGESNPRGLDSQTSRSPCICSARP